MLRQYTKSADFLSSAERVPEDYTRYADEMTADIGYVLLREVTAGFRPPGKREHGHEISVDRISPRPRDRAAG
jgi:hypothetical protein